MKRGALLTRRLVSTKPAAASKYGEVLFNEKLRKCSSVQQINQLLDAQTTSLLPQRSIRILNELSRFDTPREDTLQRVFSLAKTTQFSAQETIQFCQGLLGAKHTKTVPDFVVQHVEQLDISQFTSQTALESLRTLEKFPELKELPAVKQLATVVVEDLDDLSVAQLCAMAKHSNPAQVSVALQKRDFEQLTLADCWEVLAICGATNDEALFQKITREAIQVPMQTMSTPRLVRAFWHAGSVEKLLQQDEVLKSWDDKEKINNLTLALNKFQQQDENILKQVSLSQPPTSPHELPKYMANLGWLLAQMNFENKVATELVASLVQEFEQCDLSSTALPKNDMLQLLFAMSRFKVRNMVVLERMMVELVQNKRMDEFTCAHDIILLVWHFEKLKAHSVPFLDMATAKLNAIDIAKNEPVVTQKTLSVLLYALSRFNYRNDELMEKLCVVLQNPALFTDSTAYHLLNLLDRFSRIKYSTSPEARKLFDFVISTMKQMPDVKDLSERDLSQLLRSMASLKIQDQEFTDRLVGGMMNKTVELENKSAAHLIHLLRDISKLQHTSKADAIMPEIVKLLKQENSLVELPSHELAMLLQCFYKWGYFKDDELLHNIARELLSRGDNLFKGDLRNLSTILVNFGGLWVKSGSAGEELLLATTEELMARENLIDVGTSALSRLVSAFEKFGYRNNDLMLKIAEELVKRDFSGFSGSTLHQLAKCYSRFKVRNTPLFNAIKSELLRREDWSGLSRAALCEIAAAIAAFGYSKDSNLLFKRIGAELKQGDLATLKPKFVAELCFAFGHISVSDDELFAKIAQSMQERDDLSFFSLQRLAGIMYNFTELRQAERNRAMFELFSLHIQDRADFREILTLDLASILSSFANAKIQDRALFNMASQILQERDLTKVKEQELASFVHSFGKAKHKDEALFSILLQEISKRKFKDFTPTALVQILRGFEVFDLAKGEWMEQLAEDTKRMRGKVMV